VGLGVGYNYKEFVDKVRRRCVCSVVRRGCGKKWGWV